MNNKGSVAIVIVALLSLLSIGISSGLIAYDFSTGRFGGPDDRFQFVGGQVYSLATGILSTDTSLTLSSFTLPDDSTEITMTDFGGDIGYLTLEPGTARQEFISFTSVTQSGSNNTATIGGLTRGLRFNAPYDQNTALRQAHAGGTRVIISNPPQVYDKLTAKDNEEHITGDWTFNGNVILSSTTPPYFTSLPTISSSTQLTTKDYVDTVAFSGVPAAASSTMGGGVVAEPINIASGTPPNSQGTTAPQFLSTLHSFSNPFDCRGGNGAAATNTWCVVVTESDGLINPQYFGTSSSDTYRWGGLAIFGENDFQGFGIATTSPGTNVNLAVEGEAFFAATTTAGSLVATNTLGVATSTNSVAFGVVGHSILDGNLSLTGNIDIQGTCVGCGSTVTTFTPSTPLGATTTIGITHGTNTTQRNGYFDLPYTLTVNKISFNVEGVNTSGTIDVGIYSGDGSNKLIDVTSGTISAGGGTSVTVSAVTLNAGVYYIAVVPNGTASVDITEWNQNSYLNSD